MNNYSLIGRAEVTGHETRNNAEFQLVTVAGITGRWSNAEFLPQIGDRLLVTFNGFGTAVVRSFFQEDGWIGVEVACDIRPAWHFKQNGENHPYPMVFGAEIKPAK